MPVLTQFVQSEDGATAIEYGLIAALIAVSLIAALTMFSDNVLTLFGYVRERAGNALVNGTI